MKGSFYFMISLIVVMILVYFVANKGDGQKLSPYFLTKELVEINKSKASEANYLSNEGYYQIKDEMIEMHYEKVYEKHLAALEKERKRKEKEKKLAEQRKIEEEERQEQKDTKTMIVTAYTNGYESTQKTSSHPAYGITASGEPTQRYHTLACPPSMEFGTKVYIPKMNNTYTCLDRGSDIVEGRLDIYMKHLDDALAFGRQELKIQITQ